MAGHGIAAGGYERMEFGYDLQLELGLIPSLFLRF